MLNIWAGCFFVNSWGKVLIQGLGGSKGARGVRVQG